MRPEAVREAQDWLLRAERDLRAAERVLAGSEPLPDATVYHTQQAGEKSLKGFLVAHDAAYPFTHDLERILDLCENVDPGLSRFRYAAQVLSPYATRFRYPGGPLEPDVAEAEEAIKLAEEIVEFVRERLSAGDGE
jgi:HEPN domain-containing protein